MKSITYYQQGDVVLIKVCDIQGEKLEHRVVQEGEHTGHAHRFISNDSMNAALFMTPEKQKFLQVKGGVSTLTHEEHLPITIEEGLYEVRIIREKDIFSKLVRNVVD